MRVLLFGSGEIKNYAFIKPYLSRDAVVVACDGGLCHVEALGIMPDYLLGDFDSVPQELLLKYRAFGVPVKRFPEKKDETDMELGLTFAVSELAATDLLIFGGIGSRLDHTMANCQLLLRLLDQNIRGRLLNEKNTVELMRTEMTLSGHKGDLVSLLTLTPETTGITLTGFYYPLTDYTLKMGSPIGVSNVMLGETAKIKCKDGVLMVIRSMD